MSEEQIGGVVAPDAELLALSKVTDALQGMDTAAIARIVTYIQQRANLEFATDKMGAMFWSECATLTARFKKEAQELRAENERGLKWKQAHNSPNAVVIATPFGVHGSPTMDT